MRKIDILKIFFLLVSMGGLLFFFSISYYSSRVRRSTINAIYFNSTGWYVKEGKIYPFIAPSSANVPGSLNFSLLVPHIQGDVLIKICFTQENHLPCECCCKDSVVRIDLYNKTVFHDIVFDWEKWKCIFINISAYKGKEARFSLYDYAGGVCSQWCGEGILVDYPELLLHS